MTARARMHCILVIKGDWPMGYEDEKAPVERRIQDISEFLMWLRSDDNEFLIINTKGETDNEIFIDDYDSVLAKYLTYLGGIWKRINQASPAAGSPAHRPQHTKAPLDPDHRPQPRDIRR